MSWVCVVVRWVGGGRRRQVRPVPSALLKLPYWGSPTAAHTQHLRTAARTPSWFPGQDTTGHTVGGRSVSKGGPAASVVMVGSHSRWRCGATHLPVVHSSLSMLAQRPCLFVVLCRMSSHLISSVSCAFFFYIYIPPQRV